MARRYTLDDGKEWKDRYERGETYEQISLSYNPPISHTTIRKWAIQAGLVPRAPGNNMNTNHHNRADAKAALTPPAIRTGIKLKGNRRQGKRRRSY